MTTLATNREWLETDGLGGFASGTAPGIRTRRYHALLLAATTPPTGRVVLVNGFDAWVETANGTFSLSSQRYLQPLLDHFEEAGIGRISEIADAEAPYTPRGCPGRRGPLVKRCALTGLCSPSRPSPLVSPNPRAESPRLSPSRRPERH
jgi:glycogen debranching enzyme